jgi:hypothetical protein
MSGACKCCFIIAAPTVRVQTYIASLPAFPIIQKHPIVNSVVWLAVIFQNLFEQPAQKIIIWCFFESETPDVVQIDSEFLYKDNISKYNIELTDLSDMEIQAGMVQ